jgi:hypothetical protein
MTKLMLIAGCSHTAGSEIDGQTDSPHNRQHSYGNLLANMLGYKPINIAVSGYTNSAIARSVLEWFSNHNITDSEVFVLIGWTESARIEAPFEYPTWHQKLNGKCADWFSESSVNFLQINVAHQNYSDREKEIQQDYQTFVVRRTEYLEVSSANLVLQLQYFLKYKNIKYLMVNTNHMFSHTNEKYLDFYFQMIDKNNYYRFDNNQLSFYPKYIDLGYTNNLANYGHHGAEPHRLYAEELHKYITEKQ